MTYQLIEAHQCFDGIQSVYTHWSDETQSDMRFAIYLPPAAQQRRVPALYWLSGLTCSEQNFISKAGAQRIAAELGIAIVAPDTSPRGLTRIGAIEEEALGEAASFYVDATVMPWVDHYRMYSYISSELPRIITENFPVDRKRCGIFGHSMGGHGALTIGLRNHQLFRSLSAFAPMCAPTQVSWGKTAFQNYLGENKRTWQQYDACRLMMDHPWPHGEILIDQGNVDPYLVAQLKPDLFEAACMQVNVPLNLRMHEKYDHSYYFVATFIEDHLRFHAKNLSD
ncbi:S-formylglutathione hydrolase [Legionella antarctica]|uniref:S-formylglutathione hydrolase n=1 Tax=Legionella antarctica TaxID=2708020 RepID=A0A6F8SZY5_9GAMM|nr:S-formylglutathione hydrolase [Legionella antarctica]BCA93781.1 S-formylglutathione hydrolase [Legionella antarctica]